MDRLAEALGLGACKVCGEIIDTAVFDEFMKANAFNVISIIHIINKGRHAFYTQSFYEKKFEETKYLHTAMTLEDRYKRTYGK